MASSSRPWPGRSGTLTGGTSPPNRSPPRWSPAASPPTYVADFSTTPPHPGDRTIHDELRRVRETLAPVAAADLRFCLGRPLPPVLDGPDLAQHAADLLEWVWTHAVRPDW